MVINRVGMISISGIPKVGSTLTANVIDEDGVPTSGIVYQWLANGQAIAGANDAVYQLQSADVGKTISVQATYIDAMGHFESVVSEATNAVAPQNLPGMVSIQGVAKVGQTLSALITDVDGVPAEDAVTYQWLLDSQPIAGATAATYLIPYEAIGKVLAVRVSYTDKAGYKEAVTSVPTSLVLNDGQPTVGGYHVHQHPVYGKYVDAREFGSDPTGARDSIDAIRKALAAAHEQGAAVYLNGNLKISEQIRIDASNPKVTAIFGDGIGKTLVSFNKPQVGVHDPGSNETDSRDFAGILIDGQSGKTIGDLAVKYTGEFYRAGESYFGRVSGIMVNDASNTIIREVEVSGANRAGIEFTSTKTLTKDPKSPEGRTYKARLIRGEITENDVPVGANNQVIKSYLHHNRMAGILVAYQRNFKAEENRLERNGHEKDGGTGYGVATLAGTYNFGVIYRGNITNHNYRKGLDIHDGNDIVIENNKSIGDRLYGISVYNRRFPMNRVRIANNTVEMDPGFRLESDDDLVAEERKTKYHEMAGIHLTPNEKRRNLRTVSPGVYEIIGNKIKGLDVYVSKTGSLGPTYGIEFRNYEQIIDYTLNIQGNDIQGSAAYYLIAAINDTSDISGELTPGKVTPGPGSGTIKIIENTADIGLIKPSSTMSVFIEEKNLQPSIARGNVTVSKNNFHMRKSSRDGSPEVVQIISNAPRQAVNENIFRLGGGVIDATVSILQANQTIPSAEVNGNEFFTSEDAASVGMFMKTGRWLEVGNRAQVRARGNKHNGQAMPDKSVN